MINTIQTEGYFTRILYHDGDVRDRKMSSEKTAREEARRGSANLRADIDVCRGATVIATYRAGKEIWSVA